MEPEPATSLQSRNEVDADDDDPVDETRSSSDDDDDDDENNPMEEHREEIGRLRSLITYNPYAYDNHIELIKLMRRIGEFEGLRQARQKMHEYHPLTEALWLEWIQDEMRIMSDDADRHRVRSLFDQATNDYLSVPIWLEYVQFSIGEIAMDDGIEKCRETFEKALNKAGSHVSQGIHIWNAYREMELAIFEQEEDAEMEAVQNVDDLEKNPRMEQQRNRITKLYTRQLGVPLLGMEKTFEDLKKWSKDGGKPMEMLYRDTRKKLEKIEPFETQLAGESTPSYAAYQEYIEFELKCGEPARIQCLFERTIKDHCLESALWLQYLNYLDEKIKIESIVLPVYVRATRHCAWDVQIWIRYMRTMERYRKSHTEVKGVFEQAISANYTEPSFYLSLWTTYCDYLRRRIDWSCELPNDKPSNELHLFRATIEQAIEHLFQLFGKDGDPKCTLQVFWAAIEARFCANMTKCRELWNAIMKQGHGNQANMWLEYLILERSYGDKQHCRKLLQKAVNSVTDWPESVCEAYINYEREEGTLADYESAVTRCETQLRRLKEREEQKAQKEEAEDSGQMRRRKGGKPKNSASEFKEPGAVSQRGVKRPSPSDHTGAEPVAKRPPKKTTAIDEPNKSPAVRSDNETNKNSARPSEKQTTEHGSQDTENTVFVSNLSYDISEESLRSVFEKCGAIREIRFPMVGERSRGFAYVEFENFPSTTNALKLDRSIVGTRPMFVSVYKQRGESSAFKYKVQLEKNKLFVSNLAPSCTQEMLEDIFKKHGAVREVRLVTNRSGKAKGRAYVEFAKETDASTAVMKCDGMTVCGREMRVAISNPPARRDDAEHNAAGKSVAQHSRHETGPGAGHKDIVRNTPRIMLNFTPRSVIKRSGEVDKTLPNPVNTDENEMREESTPKPKSNADFRQFLLGKKS